MHNRWKRELSDERISLNGTNKYSANIKLSHKVKFINFKALKCCSLLIELFTPHNNNKCSLRVYLSILHISKRYRYWKKRMVTERIFNVTHIFYLILLQSWYFHVFFFVTFCVLYLAKRRDTTVIWI